MNLAQLGSRDFLKAVRPFVGLFMVLLLFAMDAELRSLFFKGGNFKTILTQTVIVAIGAMGMTLVIAITRVIPIAPMATITVCVKIVLKLPPLKNRDRNSASIANSSNTINRPTNGRTAFKKSRLPSWARFMPPPPRSQSAPQQRG